jgi:hypothetical protein
MLACGCDDQKIHIFVEQDGKVNDNTLKDVAN